MSSSQSRPVWCEDAPSIAPSPDEDWDCPFDTILARTPYFVLPKLAIQSMPMDWRRRFVALLEEAERAGLETPDYHVIRDDPGMTIVDRADSEDEYSPIESVHIVRRDPRADYRHANIHEICPTFGSAEGVAAQVEGEGSREEQP